MMSKLYLLMFAATITSIIGTTMVAPAYAEGMRQPTSGNNSLDVMVEPDWSSETTKFHVKFLDPGTDNIHEHQDYNFVISKDGQEVYNAARSQPGSPSLLHNSEGMLTIPYKFEENGDYTIQITIYGLGLPPIPIAEENATFQVNVVPEFPVGSIGAVVASLSGVVVLSRFRRFWKN